MERDDTLPAVAEPRPAALPPGERTVGQLVAESIRFYGQSFWRVLPLGLVLTAVDQASVREPLVVQAVIYWLATPLFVAGYLWACRLVLGVPVTRSATVVAVLIWLPFPALRALLVLPAVAWLAFVGLAAPAAMVEGLGVREALQRGRQLGLADYTHALGSLATLVIVVGLAGNTLSVLLHTQGNSSARVALGLADLVLSPLLFVGSALLYPDQAARTR